MPNQLERVCLECTLIAPQCDGTDKECKFVQIIGRHRVTLESQGAFLNDWKPPGPGANANAPAARAKAMVTRKRNQRMRMRVALERRAAVG